jgi:hypothetical protein
MRVRETASPQKEPQKEEQGLSFTPKNIRLQIIKMPCE